MRSTRMGPGGSILTNVSGVLHNTYVGSSGVGASSISNRRAKNRRAIVRPNNTTQNGFVDRLKITKFDLDINDINSQIQLFLRDAETTSNLFSQSRLYILVATLYEKIGKTEMVAVYLDKVALYYSNIGDKFKEQADSIPHHSGIINPYETNYISPFAKAEKYKDAARLYKNAIQYSSNKTLYSGYIDECYRMAVDSYVTLGGNAADVFDYPLASQAYALASEIATDDTEKIQYTIQSEAYKLFVS